MSDFDRLLEEELEKLKKKKKEEKQTVTPSKTLGNSLSYLPSYNRLTVADIAPVLRTTRMEEDDFAPIKTKADDSKLDFFQKGAFSDGYQFGDISKTILGTVGDVGLNVVKGIGGLGEGVGDLISYGIAGVADLAGKDEWADSVRSRAQESLVDKVTKGADDYLNQYSLLGRTSDSIAQGVGQVGAILATGGIGAAAGFGTGGVTALTTGMMGLSGMGSGMGEAYKGGATDEEALAYGAISGAADALTEMLFGGLGKAVNAVGLSRGLSSADDMLAKKVSDLFKTQIAKNVAEFGIKAGAEGFEEVLAGIAQGIGKHITYADDKELSEIMKDENLLEQFIVGAVTSGIAQAPGLNIANKTKTDFVTGQTQQEQDVLKKVVEQRIAELEKEGKTLTNKQKGEIEADVLSDMEKGYISTETIEEVLGGDNYTAYQDTIKQENDALAELAELYEGEELQQKAEEFLNNSKRNEMAKTLSDSVYDMVKDTRLGESYRDRARRGQLFEADVTKYDEKQKVTIQRAIDSGVLNNANRTHDMVDFIAKVSADTGVLFDFTNNAKLKDSIFAVGGKTVDGYITKDGITINVNSPRYINTIVGHEITHAFEGSEQYEVLEKALFEYAKEKGNYKEVLKEAYDMYSGEEGYQGYEGLKKIKKEAVANLVGDYLFTDKNFVSHLSAKHQNIFQKVWNEVKYMVKIARAGSNEAKKLLEVQKAFEDAYRNGGKTVAETKHSLSIKHTDGSVEELADARSLTNEQSLSYLEQAKAGSIQRNSYIPVRKDTPQVIIDALEQVDEKIENRSLVMQVRKAQQAMSAKNPGKQSGKHGDNVRPHALKPEQIVEIINNLDEPSTIIYQTNRVDKNGNQLPNNVAVFVEYSNNGTENVAVIEFDSSIDPEYIGTEYGDTNYHTVVTVFEPDVERNGVEFDYAEELLSNPDNIELKIERRQAEGSATGEKHPNTSNELPSIDANLTQEGKNVKYSLSKDSDGKQLTKEQTEYFKNSKMRDADGNLKVMYHGTANGGFHIFEHGYSDDDTSFFFVDNNGVASTYSGTTERYEAQTLRTAEDFNRFFAEIGASEYEVTETDGKFALLEDGDEIATSDTADGIYEEFRDWSGLGYGSVNYKVYLNLKNPLEVDADGREWNALPNVSGEATQYKYIKMLEVGDDGKVRIEYSMVGDSSPVTERVELYEKFESGLADTLSNLAPGESVEGVYANPSTTRDYAQFAKKNGYDGVIFNNIYDIGGWGGSHRKSTVAIAFDSNQIKSVANSKPTADPDIRYSLSKDSEGRKLSENQSKYFKGSKVTDENGNLKVVYHGSPKDFNTFSLEYLGTNGTAEGYGFYFTDKKSIAENYSRGYEGQQNGKPGKLFECYLDIKKPLSDKEVTMTRAQFKKFLTTLNEQVDADGEPLDVLSNYGDVDWEGLNKVLSYAMEVEYDGSDSDVNLVHSIINGCGNMEVVLDVLRKTLGYDGIIVNEATWGGDQTIYIAFHPEQIKNIDNANPTTDPDIRHSLSKDDTHPIKQGNWHISGKDIAYEDIAPVGENVSPTVSKTETTTEELFPDDLGSAQYETESFDSIDDADAPPEMDTAHDEFADTTPLNKKTVTDLSKKVKNLLGIKNNRTGEVVSMIEAYSRSEERSTEKLFEELKDKFGKYTEKYGDEPTKELKALLRGYKINVSDSIKSEIADYADLMRRNFGRVRFSKEGMNVDEVYEDLHASYPGYFPKSIINPTDQLLRIIDVANLEAEDVVDMEVDDESLADAARTIARTVRAYQQSQMQALSNREGREAFDSLMESADDIAPVGDIAPVVKQKEKTAKIEKPAEIAPEVKIKTVKERLTAKMQGLETELANNRKLREESWSGYDSEIARAKAEYNAKSNKNTVAANDLLRRIERLNRMKHNADADYAKRISDLEERVASVGEEIRTGESASEQGAMRQELHSRILANIKNTFEQNGFNLETVLGNAKNLSTFATVDNTPQRVMEKALGYKAGQILSDLTVNQVAQNETKGIQWLNTFTDRKNGVLAQLSKKYHIKPGSKESAAAQMYAEGFYVTGTDKNGEWFDGKSEIVPYGDAELAQDFPDENVRANIKGLARDPQIRRIYDETLVKINESRARNAYPEIQRLDNYFLHFRSMEDAFSRLGIPFNLKDIKAKDLPTDLNGVTADLKPGQPYFASAMHREGKRTSFDLLGGLERYLSSAKNQIYHIDDIQTLRALRNYVADTYGQANGLKDLDLMTEEEAQARIKEVYKSHLSTFAKFLNEEANVIAGKTALIDRGLEGVIGRRGITFLDTVNRQVGSNMVGFNISSSLTNFLPVAQTLAKTNKFDFLKAFAQTVSNKVGSVFGRGDSFTEDSPVFIRRKGEERFYRTPWQKAGDAGYMLMGAVDDISTELIARTKYNELTRKGMDSKQAHYETDKWVSRLMGDRSLGQQPQLYNSKMIGMITKFQLEVRNQLDAQFYDTIQEEKVSNEYIQNGLLRNAKTAAKVGSTFFQLAVAQHLFGKAFESVAGYNPAFDIISVLIKTFGWDDDDESEDTVLDNIHEGFLELLGDLPYTSTLTGGRLPIESALPIEELVNGKDKYGNEKHWLKTVSEAAPYYVLPGGYGQIKKTYQGLSMFDDDLPVSGSYTDSGNLRFPVEDTIGNRVQAGLFGQYASQNARDYFDNERSPLKPNQIQEYIDVDLPIADYWKYREGLSEHPTLDAKGDYIGGLDLPISKKNILINNIAKREEPINMADYAKYPNFHEFDWAEQNEEKYAFLQEHGMSYSDYEKLDEDSKKAYTWAYNNPEKYDFVRGQGLSATEYYSLDDDTKDAYGWAYDNPESYTVSKAVSNDFLTYYQYKTDLSKLNAKNENGESVSGLKKERVIDYINGLDIDYGQKIILFRSMYDSKADQAAYNADIVDYLNSRDDLSYEEIVTILKKLGFTVTDDGTVKW